MRVLGEIKTIDDWERFGGPVSGDQWVDGRSAKELAKAWMSKKGPRVPRDFWKLLQSHQATRDLKIGDVFPEARLTFDECGGNVRNSDLAFVGTNPGGTLAVTVEAKADEPFGNYSISEEIERSKQLLVATPKSKKLARIDGLLNGLLGQSTDSVSPEIGELRYQLFTALAGTLAFAKENNAQAAVMAIHVFRTDLTTKKKIENNDEDYYHFLNVLEKVCGTQLSGGPFHGPFQVGGCDRYTNPPPFYITKLTTELRSLPT